MIAAARTYESPAMPAIDKDAHAWLTEDPLFSENTPVFRIN